MLKLIVLLIVGFIFLARGADWLVIGSSRIARWFGIPAIVVGLTVVAFGTSMPELVVSFSAALRGSPDLSLGNILGSNISNILLILGLVAIIATIKVQSSTVRKEIPFFILAAVFLGISANDIFFQGASINIIGRGDGIILLTFFAFFVYYVVGVARNKGSLSEKIEEARFELRELTKKRHPIIWFVGQIVLGLTILIAGGQIVVIGATGIAKIFGLSEALIGLTIIAIGTSLPELATSVIAAYKKEADIAIGNIVGSNIFNILWIVGVTSLVRPLAFSSVLNTDILLVVLVSIILFGAILFFGKRLQLGRGSGILFIILYLIYILFLLGREGILF